MYKFPENPYSGELLPNERLHLFNWIIDKKPKCVFEIGTGQGGGSSFFILDALLQLQSGHLYTFDPLFDNIEKLYKNTPYENLFTYYKEQGKDILPSLINQNIIPDCIFHDGGEDPFVVLYEVMLLEQYVQDGCILIVHDWFSSDRVDGNVSTKNIILKTYIEMHVRWEILDVLDKEQESVGLMRAIYNDKISTL